MHRLTPVTLALALMARGAIAQCPDGTPPPCRAAGARAPRPASPAPMSVAVLDFENLSRDSSDVYLSQGLAEELTSQLGQVGRLTVTSRAVVRRLHDVVAMSVPEIGHALNVTYLLNGSLRRSGTRLRVTAELLRANTGAQVWSSQYDQSTQDLLAIQEAVAAAVAAAVAGRLLPAERATLAARPTRNTAAYEAYLRGRALYRVQQTTSDATEAVALFERAVALDSSFAAAWAGLSILQSSMFWNYRDRSDERLAKARAAAERAAVLAPNASAAHVALGYYHYWGSRDYARALQEFSAALAAQPNDPEVHAALANVARRQGSWERSLASRSRAIELDPGDGQEFATRGETLALLRRFDEAEPDYERALAVAPNLSFTHGYRAQLVLARDGSFDRARASVESLAVHAQAVVTLQAPGGGLPVWRVAGPHQAAILRAHPAASPEERAAYYLTVGEVLAAQGRRLESGAAFDSLRGIVQDLLRLRSADDGLHGILARAYRGLGRCDDALREAEHSVALLPVAVDALDGPEHVQNLAEIEAACGRPEQAIDHVVYLLSIPSYLTGPLLRADPVWAPLRGNPRFERLIAGN
jgi:serine/threonine-protein kinase